MTRTDAQLDLTPVAEKALAESLERLDLTIDDVRRHGLRRVSSELERLADVLRKGSTQTETDAQLTAARAALGLFQVDTATLTDTVPDSTWDLLDALVVTAYSTDSQPAQIYAPTEAGKYARVTLGLVNLPHGRGTGSRRDGHIPWNAFRDRMRNPESRRAAVGIACKNGFAHECLEELGDCLDDDDPFVRWLAALTFLKFNDYNYDYDPDDGAPMIYFDPTPVVDELLTASEDNDQRVREAAVDALHQLQDRSDEINEDKI